MFVESSRKRRRKNRLTTLAVCLLVLAMAMYGYNYSHSEVRQQIAAGTQKPSASALATPNIPVIVQTEIVIAQHATIVLKTKYLGCGHIVEKDISVDGVVGLNKEQFAALYPQCVITTFSQTRVEMIREVEGVCQKHYVLKQEGTKLVIYQRADDDSWRKVQTIEGFTMTYQDKALEQGVVFDDMHQIESYLENFE